MIGKSNVRTLVKTGALVMAAAILLANSPLAAFAETVAVCRAVATYLSTDQETTAPANENREHSGKQ